MCLIRVIELYGVLGYLGVVCVLLFGCIGYGLTIFHLGSGYYVGLPVDDH